MRSSDQSSSSCGQASGLPQPGGASTHLRPTRVRWHIVALLAVILAGVALAWNWFFVFFHRIFFTGDTWLFLYSDSLIRLFPEMFWQDCFVTLGVGTGLSAAALWVVVRVVERRLRVTAGAMPGGAER